MVKSKFNLIFLNFLLLAFSAPTDLTSPRYVYLGFFNPSAASQHNPVCIYAQVSERHTSLALRGGGGGIGPIN